MNERWWMDVGGWKGPNKWTKSDKTGTKVKQTLNETKMDVKQNKDEH
jgi:hypothetical protein